MKSLDTPWPEAPCCTCQAGSEIRETLWASTAAWGFLVSFGDC